MAYRTRPAESAYHATLPLGERLSSAPLIDDPLSCFEEVRLKPLAPMLVPEAPRAGELDRSDCVDCGPWAFTIWRDDRWHVNAGFEKMGIPFIGSMAPNQHVRLEDAPVEIVASMGLVMQRLNAAVKTIPGVARTHFSRWGDGSEHFHIWALARPTGMMQGRGAMLMFWNDVLPAMRSELAVEHMRIVATAMARGGGEAFPYGVPPLPIG